jgi:cell division septation protein DedD
MNSKNLLSTLLYALIGLLLVVVGYKACQIRKEKDAVAAETEKFDQQLRDMGYTESGPAGDTTTEGSAFVSEKGATYRDGAQENPTTTKSAPVSSEGIESDAPKSPAKSPAKTTEQVVDEEGQKVSVSDLDSEMGMTDKPKYMVITGSFKQLANARKAMEQLVKKGYTDAEVGRFNRGAYACAIAKRTDSKSEADKAVAKLKQQGFKDSFVKAAK